MKRSEMLKVIIKELDKNYPNQGLNTAGIAHDILYRIEDLGMFPPPFDKDHKELIDEYGVSLEWEPEDG